MCSGLARRPLKAVARVRIPSGLQDQNDADQAWCHHQPASISSGRPSGTREGRNYSHRCCLRHAPDQPTSRAQTWGSTAGGVVLSRGGPRLGPQGRPGTTRIDDQPQCTRRRTQHSGDHRACGIRLKDAGGPQKLAIGGDFPDQSPFSQNRRREMTNELDRLLTITDLSEMLGVPVDTLYGWRHRGEGPAGYRIGRHVRYRRAAVEAWLDTRVDRLQR